METDKATPASNGEGLANTQVKGPKKTQFRFNGAKDLALVLEVKALHPFLLEGAEEGESWNNIATTIQEKFGKSVSVRCVKERFKALRKDFKKEDFRNRYKSGTEEDYDVLKQTLTELDNLIKDQELVQYEASQAKSKKQEMEKAAGEEIRNASLAGLTPKRKEPDEPRRETPRRRSTEGTLMQAWYDKQEDDRNFQNSKLEKEAEERSLDREVRKEEILLERERLAFEKEKADKDRELQLKRFELEREERMSQVNTQKVILEMLAKITEK